MKFNNKGQAALEFMMTYGWAILVVLAAIGALSYFGVLNPSKFTPETCLSSSGFSCAGGKALTNTTSMSFTVVNGIGYAVNFTNSTKSLSNTLSSCSSLFFCSTGNTTCNNVISVNLEDGGSTTMRLVGCSFTAGSIVKGDVKLPFTNPSNGLQEYLIVTITGKP